MDTPELYRTVNTILSTLIAGTLSWRHIYYLRRDNTDDRLRAALLVIVFGWTAVSSSVAIHLGLPLPFTVKVLTLLLTAYLVSLWTPWRWQPRRIVRHVRDILPRR